MDAFDIEDDEEICGCGDVVKSWSMVNIGLGKRVCSYCADIYGDMQYDKIREREWEDAE